jgi:hypothetical protein
VSHSHQGRNTNFYLNYTSQYILSIINEYVDGVDGVDGWADRRIDG